MYESMTKSDDICYHILCATDDNYVPHCGVMITSLLSNHKGNFDVVIHLIDDHICEENKQKLIQIVCNFNQEIIFHAIDAHLIEALKLQGDTYTLPIVYYRLFVSRILDTSINKVLYLDCDLIVLKDIVSLFKINMDKFAIAAVRDVNQPMWEEQAFQMGFSYTDRYFNSGVLLINLEKWRRDKVENELFQFSVSDRRVFFPDQDALNKVFRDKWLELPPYWNRFNLVRYKNVVFKNQRDFLDYIYSPSIVHFASKTARPWMKLHFVPFGDKYNDYCALTPWKNDPKLIVQQNYRYVTMLKYKCSNILYRSPMIVHIIVNSIFGIIMYFYHIVRHLSLRYYKINSL